MLKRLTTQKVMNFVSRRDELQAKYMFYQSTQSVQLSLHHRGYFSEKKGLNNQI